MTDKKTMTANLAAGRNLPALRPEASARPSLPSLPATSGAWLGTRVTIMRKDAEFVRQHTEYLQARTSQSNAMRELVDSRLSLATTIAKLSALPEIAEHEYLKGRADRAYEMCVLTLRHQTGIADAEATLVQAQQYLASLRPQPTQPTSPPAPAPQGLTPAEVNEVIAALDDISPEVKKTISYILMARMQEKQ